VISDANGPIPGANVFNKAIKRSTQTDFNGKYSIIAKSGQVLEVSYVGMKNTSVTVGVSNTLNVKTAAAEEMDEVVVVAYGRAKSFLYWFCTLKGEFRKQSNYKRSFWN
jgi:hypothetical protein